MSGSDSPLSDDISARRVTDDFADVEGSGSVGASSSESHSPNPMDDTSEPENPFGATIEDLWGDVREMTTVHPGTWIPALVLTLVVLPIFAILWLTIGMVEMVGQFFWNQVHLMKLRAESSSVSDAQKSGYLFAVGVLYLIGLIPWTIALPFKIIAWSVDRFMNVALPESPTGYLYLAFVLLVVGSAVYFTYY